MCTVTFIPADNGYFLTHSRDEKKARKKASVPCHTIINNKKLIFPIDGESGGSWIALQENGNAVCLLNGAFKKFTDSASYKISRGKIFLELASSENIIHAFDNILLHNIAPFTLIIFQYKNLFECRWDGVQKHIALLKNTSPRIWSSCTLYDEENQQNRLTWFNNWLLINPVPSVMQIINFHTSAGDGDVRNNLLMERDGIYSTVSITSIAVTADDRMMQYLDTETKEFFNSSFSKEKSIGA